MRVDLLFSLLLLLLLLPGCGGDTGSNAPDDTSPREDVIADGSDGPETADTPVEDADAATDEMIPVVSAPFDLNVVVRRVQLGFRPAPDGFEGGPQTYAATVSSAGRLRFLPAGNLGNPQAHAAGPSTAFELDTRVVGRADQSLVNSEPFVTLGSNGALAIDRGGVVEHLQNTEQGVAQSWSFEALPPGDGALQLRLQVAGREFAGEIPEGLRFADPEGGVAVRYGLATWIDANGERTSLRPRFEAGHITIEVPESVLLASRFPAVLDPVISAELGIREAGVTFGEVSLSDSAVAFDGTNYLVVFSDPRGARLASSPGGSAEEDFDWSAILATRVASDGSQLDPLGIVLAPGGGRLTQPAVAFDGENYLAVWQREAVEGTFSIQGRRIAPAGALPEPAPIEVAADGVAPDVAFGAFNHLVVFNRAGTLFGTRVRPSGAVVDPDGFEIPGSGFPAVAYGAGRFLVVGGGQSGALVWPDGSAATTEQLNLNFVIHIATPDVAFDGTNFFVVWQDYLSGCPPGVCTNGAQFLGQFIDPDGDNLGGDPFNFDVASACVSCGGPLRCPRLLGPGVGFDGSNYLVVPTIVEHVLPGGGPCYPAEQTRLLTYAPDGTLLGDALLSNFLAASSLSRVGPPAVACETGSCLVTGDGAMRVAPGVSTTVIDDPPIVVSIGHRDERNAVSAFDGTNFLVVWEEGTPRLGTGFVETGGHLDLMATRVSQSGEILDPAGIIVSDAPADQFDPIVAYGGGQYLVAWTDDRGAPTQGDDSLCPYVARITPAGTVLDPDGIGSANEFLVCRPTDDLTWPPHAVAYDGSNFVVLAGRNAYRVDPGGNVAVAALSVVPAFARMPRVACSGANCLLAWVDPVERIQGRRLANDDSLLETSTVLATAGVARLDRSSFGLAYGDTQYLLTWAEGDFITDADIFATRIDADAVVLAPLDVPPITVSSAAGIQRSPETLFEGLGFVVAWEDERGGDPDIYATGVTTLGTVLDSSGIAVSAEVGSEQRVRLSSNGAGLLFGTYDRIDQRVEPLPGSRVFGRFARFLGQLPQGAPCNLASDCETDSCSDGVCCDSACDGGCDACSIAAGALADGFCAILDANTLCRAGFDACMEDAFCDGQVAACPPEITFLPLGTECRPAEGPCDAPDFCVLTPSGPRCAQHLYQPAGTVCGPAQGICDAVEVCSGTSPDCPPDNVVLPGTVCRAAPQICDAEEVCGGDSYDCPPDVLVPADVVCRAEDTGAGCDVEETCTGTDPDCPADLYADAGIVCGPEAGVCDLEEVCPGGSPDCPVDVFDSGTVCNPSVGDCDPAEVCSGADPDCPADALADAGTVCRAAAEGSCDAGEACTGDSPDCPPDVFQLDGFVCRPTDGNCDVAEKCPGGSPDCPADGFLIGGLLCRAADGLCDVGEFCTGSAARCPTDGFVVGGVTCRVADGDCDVTEACTGASPDCPVDDFEDGGTECRPALGVCDLTESCSGTDPDCPIDARASSATVCRDSVGDCDVEETCDGRVFCPENLLVAPGTECRSAAGLCDIPEECTGFTGFCPSDRFAAVNAPCRSSEGLCDPEERCPGDSPSCPADQLAADDIVCRGSAGDCDVVERCTGVEADCPINVLVPGDTVCRDAEGDCDVEEACSGDTPDCPADAFIAADTVCRDAAGDCDTEEACTGDSGDCPEDSLVAADTVCRDAEGQCDVAEACTGVDTDCPIDALLPAGELCRPADGVCDAAEACTGDAVDCPTDAFADNTRLCRAALGECDLAESCSGVSTGCPSDLRASTDTVCRASDGDCDLPETCTGEVFCPQNRFVGAGTECRAMAGDCDVAEMCTGAGPACPGNGFASPGLLCRSAAGQCDVSESCSGASATCPVDLYASATVTCRPSADLCDFSERCTGADVDCPADSVASLGTVCRVAAGACDAPETCSGSETVCPADAYRAAGSECRPALGVCDLSETCTGGDPSCPEDARLANETVCRESAGDCDLAEQCDGSVFCPENAFVATGTECRPAAGDCDLAEACNGVVPSCPANVFVEASAVCRAAAGDCDLAELCPGDATDCPADAIATAEVVCRGAAGDCDAPETCTGDAADCPLDDPAGLEGESCSDTLDWTEGDLCLGGDCLGTEVGSCDNPDPLDAEQPIETTTDGRPSHIDSYGEGCDPGSFDGGDVVFELMLEAGTSYAVTVEPGAELDAVVAMVAGCDDLRCLAWANEGNAGDTESVVYTPDEDMTLYVIVDAEDSNGDFTVEVVAEALTAEPDDDAPDVGDVGGDDGGGTGDAGLGDDLLPDGSTESEPSSGCCGTAQSRPRPHLLLLLLALGLVFRRRRRV